jgi:hypothetical protein
MLIIGRRKSAFLFCLIFSNFLQLYSNYPLHIYSGSAICKPTSSLLAIPARSNAVYSINSVSQVVLKNSSINLIGVKVDIKKRYLHSFGSDFEINQYSISGPDIADKNQFNRKFKLYKGSVFFNWKFMEVKSTIFLVGLNLSRYFLKNRTLSKSTSENYGYFVSEPPDFYLNKASILPLNPEIELSCQTSLLRSLIKSLNLELKTRVGLTTPFQVGIAEYNNPSRYIYQYVPFYKSLQLVLSKGLDF